MKAALVGAAVAAVAWFAPSLVGGGDSLTQSALTGAGCAVLFPGLGIPAPAFAVVGMAALFTGIVRAPLTGIVLITEMTAAFNLLLLPMLAACFAAMLIPTLLRDLPIYEALREGTLRRERALKPK